MESSLDSNLLAYSNISALNIDFSSNDLELDILHNVYGEDIPIAIDPVFIANKFNVDIIEKDFFENIESQIYLSNKTQKITIEYKKVPEFKKSFIICQNLGHLFLHIFQYKKVHFVKKISPRNNFQEHRISNNILYKTQKEDYLYEEQADLFAGKLLIPRGALLEIFKDLKQGERFLLSDICKVFNSPNDIMVEMLKFYGLWDFSKIYDNL